MPTQTFLKLDVEKKNRFLDAAFKEFALYDYQSASISRIVKQLEIAKGSVYQYFENKNEMYLYLLDQAATCKLEYIQKHIDTEPVETDFFSIHKAVIIAGANFDFTFPQYGLLLMNAMKEKEHSELGDLAGNLTRRSFLFLKNFIVLGIEKGEIRSDIDPLLITHTVNSMTFSLASYMEEKYDFSLYEQLRQSEKPLPFSQAELEEAVNSLITIIKTGLLFR